MSREMSFSFILLLHQSFYDALHHSVAKFGLHFLIGSTVQFCSDQILVQFVHYCDRMASAFSFVNGGPFYTMMNEGNGLNSNILLYISLYYGNFTRLNST